MQIGIEPEVVLFFECPEEEMVKRVLSRNQVVVWSNSYDSVFLYSSLKFDWSYSTQGRVDDNIETIKKRLKVFAGLNLPVVKYYSEKGKLYKVFLNL